ncbi:LOW QUALITY PROTEIN: hypothetical protein CFOL_v3_35402, partial [Cephalotus follicularis]
HIHFIKQEMSLQKFEEQLQIPTIQQKIQTLKDKIILNLCDLPDAFWYRKCHMVSLPYEKDFSEQNIHTKARPIQMARELMKHCKKETEELIAKKLIRPSKSILFAENFSDIITDKQLQRFLGSLNYIRDFILILQHLCIPLYKRLRKTPPLWMDKHTQLIDILNQKFLIIVDCAATNSILTKDVKNLVSKQIFARWQGILSSFDFTIQRIKGDSNSKLDYLTLELL